MYLFNLLFLLKQKLTILLFQVLATLNKSLFPGISFLRIELVMSLHFQLYQYFSFALTRKPYPNSVKYLPWSALLRAL